ncbi:MAG: zinc ABC transporter substrate-binding protein [Phycisphaerae bacterium]
MLLVSAIAGCGQQPAESRADSAVIRAFVSIPPQAYFVERIGGSRVHVESLVGPGQSPHVFEPTPRQAAELAQARIYFTIGLPFEQRMIEKLCDTFRNLRFVDSGAGVPRRLLESGELCAHDEHSEHEHAHSADQSDPHIWMSPRLAKTLATNICDGLSAIDPPGAEEYRANRASLLRDLDDLHAELSAALAPLRGREIFVYHAAFGYFTAEYGLRQVAVEIGGREPTPQQLADLIAHARAAGVRVVFVLPQFSKKSAEALAHEIGAAVVPIDDLSRDYVSNLRDVARKIARALSEGPPS